MKTREKGYLPLSPTLIVKPEINSFLSKLTPKSNSSLSLPIFLTWTATSL